MRIVQVSGQKGASKECEAQEYDRSERKESDAECCGHGVYEFTTGQRPGAKRQRVKDKTKLPGMSAKPKEMTAPMRRCEVTRSSADQPGESRNVLSKDCRFWCGQWERKS